MENPQRTALVGGDVVAFDGADHRLIRGGTVVYEGDKITHVGRDWDGHGSKVDATGKLVIPGQISTHAHVGAHEGGRLLVDGGRRDFFRSGFLNYLPTKRSGGPGFLAQQDGLTSLRYGMASLIRHGVTTVLPFAPGGADQGATMAKTAGEFGLRVYYAPLVTGGRYFFGPAGEIEQDWDEAAALKGLDAAAQFAADHRDGLVRGVIAVDEFHFSTPAMRRRAFALAEELDVSFTLHCAEQLPEFTDCVRKTGKTPVELLASEGVLSDRTILAHCLYIAGHSATAYPYVDDIAILADSGAVVAHSPAGFARRGLILESFQRYLDRGVTMALATDSYPLDMFGEMRMAAVGAKMMEKNHEAGGAMDVFRASNLGGAKALRRDDLGRLSVGAKADIVLVDFANLAIGPSPDPIRSLVHFATPEMVDTVIVDGRTLMAGKKLLVCDEQQLLADVRASADRVYAAFPDYHWSGQRADQVFPPSIKEWGA